MPPLCTPDKIEPEYTLGRISPDGESPNNLYFNPSKLSPDRVKEDFDCNVKILNLLHSLPDVDKYFNVRKIIGEGTFGTVFLAHVKGDETRKKFAIKHLIPTSHPRRVAFELKCMKEIGGSNNVAGTELSLRNMGNVVFVMEYHHHEPFSHYVKKMDAVETALYMKNLLIALAHVHKFKIIHRDIKPSNFLYDRRKKTFLLIDFGLAQEVPNTQQTKDIAVATAKRKREPLSPINNILQPPKRPAFNTNRLNTQGTFEFNIAVTKIPNSRYDKTYCKENNPNYNEINRNHINIANNTKAEHVKIPTFSANLTKSAIDTGVAKTDECHCYGKAKMCSKCVTRPALKAPRAGTPGYRPPEVLFKHPDQTTAVDVWAAGIIMISIFSNCTNFFESPNDLVAIAELITIFGYEDIKKVASLCGRFLICHEKKPKLNLRKICCILRNRPNHHLITSTNCQKCENPINLCVCTESALHKTIHDHFPTEAYNLLIRLLDVNPNSRITAVDALKHPFFTHAQ